MTEPLSDDALASFGKYVESGDASTRKDEDDALRAFGPSSPLSTLGTPPRHYIPLVEAAYDFQQWAEHPELRVYTGIDELDRRMRGTAPGELTQILGFSHGGKTVVASQILLNNRDKRMVLFTPDETRTAVLVKMVSLIHRINAEDLERRVFERDPSAVQLLVSTATHHLPNLGVCEQNLTLHEMEEYLHEYEAIHGPVDGVMYDFLGLLQGMEGDIVGKFGAMKAWGKRVMKPLFVLHQSSRTAGKDGAKVTLSSGTYGGESESTHIIGVRRKRAEIHAEMAEIMEKIDTAQRNGDWLERRLATLRYDAEVHDSTITLNLVKNKRPPMHLVDDLDYNLDRHTGKITPIAKGDMPDAHLRSTQSARQALLEKRELF